MRRRSVLIRGFMVWLVCWTLPAFGQERLPLLPWPKSVEMGSGRLELTDKSRIVSATPSLRPLASVLQEEIHLATGIALGTAQGKGRKGDIVLEIDPRLKAGAEILCVQGQNLVRNTDGAYLLTVNDRATVRGFDYRAVAEGTATLLQALTVQHSMLSLPILTIHDWPAADYTGAMADVARQEISIDTLKQTVEACRLYKVRYLQLHLTDDQGWTFPSHAFPQLGTRNSAAHGGIAPRLYTEAELKDLVAYADVRGVTLVPEIETPGHAGAALRALPAIFDSIDPATGKMRDIALMNMGNPKLYDALDTIVGEVCAVFKSSPYFHIGCDETWFGAIDKAPEIATFMQANGLKDHGALFAYFVRRMVDIVKKHGKKPILWEGGANEVTKDAIVMTWVENTAAARHLIDSGFTTITVPWTLGVPTLPEWSMYRSNTAVLHPGDSVLGASVVLWEMNDQALMSEDYARRRLPERQERTWGPDNQFTMPDFERRYAADNALLSRLAQPIQVTVKKEELLDLPSVAHSPAAYYNRQATVSLESAILPPGAQIRYTLDGSAPTTTSPLYTGPVTIKDDSATVHAQLFAADGKPIAYGTIRKLVRVDYEHNLTTGRPVTTSGGTQIDMVPENVVDGYVFRDKSWWAAPWPQWLRIDLQQVHTLDRIHVFPYWDGYRYYQYTVSLSTDGKTWTQVVDASKNTTPATSHGVLYRITPTPARYVRIDMLRNSANEGVHLVELRVYEPGTP